MTHDYLHDYTILIIRRFRNQLVREVEAIRQVPVNMAFTDEEMELAEEWVELFSDQNIEQYDTYILSHFWFIEFNDAYERSNRSAIRTTIALVEAIEDHI